MDSISDLAVFVLLLFLLGLVLAFPPAGTKHEEECDHFSAKETRPAHHEEACWETCGEWQSCEECK